jgi:hypothetical protein
VTPFDIARAISELNARDLRVLNQLLKDSGMGDALGVREPRKPKPESPGDAIANPLPEDYWETAE